MDLPSTLKGRFPFRLGSTSYIVPADIETNVDRLLGVVDDVELLFFESHEQGPLPGVDTVRHLRDVAERSALTYTVHLPLDIHLGHPDAAERERSAEKCRRVAALTEPLSPFAYVLHVYREADTGDSDDALRRWQSFVVETLARTLLKDVDPFRVCLETLDYPFEWITPIADALGLSRCLDVGHMLLHGFSVEDYLAAHFSCTRVVHLHGVRDGRDHRDISCVPESLLSLLREQLYNNAAAERTLTVEVFSADALAASLPVLEEWIQ